MGDLVVATFSVEMSDSSDISSRSSVSVDVAKSSSPFCFLSLPVHLPPGSHLRQGPDGPLFLTLPLSF